MSSERLRQLAIAWIGLFVVSTAFPVVAGLLDTYAMPSWLGPLDVAFAVVTALLGFYLVTAAGPSIGQSSEALSYRVLRAAASAFLILIVVFFLAPEAVNWTVMAIGLAWRAWLLVIVLPGVITHVRGGIS